MRTLVKAVLTLAIGIGWISTANAANPFDRDSLTVTIVPNAYYALDITTGTHANLLNLGSVELGASTQTVHPATVTITSTYATTDLKLLGNVVTAVSPWAFNSSGTVTADQLAGWANFTTTAVGAAPVQGNGSQYFRGTTIGAADSDLIDNASSRDVGNESGGSNSNFYETDSGATGFLDMDGLAKNAQAHLWLWFRIPWSSTTNGTQTIVITLIAGVPVN